MRWDLVTDDNEALAWTKRLIRLHREHRALRVGNHRAIIANGLLAFERYTDRAADTVLVLVNPGDTEVTETVMLANSKLMDCTRLIDLLGAPGQSPLTMWTSLLDVTVPAKGCRVLAPELAPPGGYSNYKRVQ